MNINILTTSSLISKALLIAMALLTLSFHGSFISPQGELTVKISGLKNDKGSVLISIYNSSKGFPKVAGNAVEKRKAVIKNGMATVTFKNLPYGKYAAAILHDENENLKMDLNFLGMPKEGYGFSNNAKGSFGPPTFEEAAFAIKSENEFISIKISYIFK